MKFLGVKFKVVEEDTNLYWTLISSNTLVNQFHQHAKSREEAIERTKKIILLDGEYAPTWVKGGLSGLGGADYYLVQKPFHYKITKCNKKEWKFEGFEYQNSAYTNNYCLSICTTLIEAKQKVFKAYQFMSDRTYNNGKVVRYHDEDSIVGSINH